MTTKGQLQLEQNNRLEDKPRDTNYVKGKDWASQQASRLKRKPIVNAQDQMTNDPLQTPRRIMSAKPRKLTDTSDPPETPV